MRRPTWETELNNIQALVRDHLVKTGKLPTRMIVGERRWALMNQRAREYIQSVCQECEPVPIERILHMDVVLVSEPLWANMFTVGRDNN